ncbi:HNH endonuclease [Mycobacterium sp. CnD-18-1]|uniref:HNH endonuclease n=1 Tax=Mycobacterium sp. CnD-18-1 TaxID=2917744 RepID=UPI001EF1F73C|nr:hypothetical protein [Mycobacterium sp. CnD-18-1]MCG7610355.1 hypothetical protein [Mycobacterium sp. CnD-18-1]
MSKAWGNGSTRQWRKTRADALHRDGHQCRLRYAGCTGHATEVHHLDGKVNGDNLDRCVSACHRCHAVATRQQTIDAAARRPRKQRQAETHPGLR